ncbi:3-oxosteroid 1-dehydrogenase [compost metagenome]
MSDDFAQNLDTSIERYNGFAEAGRDADFDRGLHEYDRIWNKLFSPVSKNAKFPANDKPNPTMYPIDRKGTLYAVILAPGALDTNAGPAINPHAQVLSAKGEPIPGLYGAGNCIASPSGPAYLGAGGTIGLAMTFGYLAARHAVGQA